MTKLYNSGVEAADKLQWQKAYEAFLAAWTLRQHPQVAANLGRAELKVSKPLEAAEHLAFFLREAKEVDAPAKARAQQMLDEAKRKIGTLTITANRDGATLFVDEVEVGVSPLARELYVQPGKRQVEARLPGGATAKLTVEVAPGSVRQVGLGFAEEVAGPVVGLPPKAGPRVDPMPPVEARSRRSTAIVIGGIAGTVVLGGLGVGYAVASNAKAGERDELVPAGCDEPENCVKRSARRDYNDLEFSRTDLANRSFWSFVAAGTVGVGTLVYVLLTPEPRRDGAAVNGVSLSIVPGGIVVSRRW